MSSIEKCTKQFTEIQNDIFKLSFLSNQYAKAPVNHLNEKNVFFPFATFRRILKLFLEPPTFTILGLQSFLTSFFTTNTVMCNCIVWLVVNRKVVNHK